jgi:hypothetical protein
MAMLVTHDPLRKLGAKNCYGAQPGFLSTIKSAGAIYFGAVRAGKLMTSGFFGRGNRQWP